MPRVVCLVRARPGRVTFTWSEGKASFPPYPLTDREAAELLDLAGRARAELQRLAGAPEEDTAGRGRALAEIGHALWRLLFRQGEDQPGTAGAVRSWLAGLEGLDRLEVLGDHEVLPWNVLYDVLPEGKDFGSGGSGWQSFWGIRHNLATGRRVGPLRPVRLLEQPAVLLVIDPVLRASLPDSQQKRLGEFAEVNHLPLVESLADLRRAYREQPPDLLYFFCRADAEALLLGDARLTVVALRDLLRDENSGDIPWNSRLLFVNACAAGPTAGASALLGALPGLGLGGLIYPEAPAPAHLASPFGLDLLTGLLYQKEPAGTLLQKLRGRTAPFGLLYHTSWPPLLRVNWQEDEGQPASPEAPRDEDEPEPLPLPDRPYRPLLPYDREDRALFVGRESETTLVADLLDAPGTRIVLVHGRSGIGKSSLLRAGVLPYVEEVGAGYRALRDRSEEEDSAGEDDYPVIAIRTTNDLPGQLALALCAFCARPYTFATPTGGSVTVDLAGLLHPGGRDAARADDALPAAKTGPPPLPLAAADAVRAALVDDPALLGRVLTALADNLPFEPLLLVEQGEEMFTLARQRADADNRAVAVDMLRQTATTPGAGRLLVSLRTEYFGRLTSQLERSAEAHGLHSFFLLDLTEAAMLEAVVQPTLATPVPYSAEAPLQKYGFTFAAGLAESIVRQVRQTARDRQDPALPLLQAVCARLSDLARSRPDRTISPDDLRAIGGIAGGLASHVETLIEASVPGRRDRRHLQALLHELYIAQPDGTVTRDLVPEERLAEHWRGKTPLAAVLEQGALDEVRLFETTWQGPVGREKQYVSLGHDALAPVAARWDRDEEVRRAHGRKVTVDWLWVVLPLGVLLAVLGWYWWKYQVGYKDAVAETRVAQEEKALLMAKLSDYQKGVEALRWPLYVTHLGQAEAAAGTGDLLHLRQLLLNHRESPRTADDLRGFEWYHLWLLADRARATLFGHPGGTSAVAMTPDGKRLASAGADGTIRLWDAAGGQQAVLQGHTGPVAALALAADGGRLVSAGADGLVKVWDLARPSRAEAPITLPGHTGPLLGVALSADGKTVASAGQDGTIKLWDAAGGAARQTLKQGSPVVAVAFSPDGKVLASAGEDRKVVLWDPVAGTRQHDLAQQPGSVHALAFAPDSKVLAVGGGLGEKGTVTLWDVATRQEAKVTLAAPAPVLALAFVGPGQTLATAGKDNAIRLWEVATGKEQDVFRGHLGWVSALAVSADGKTLASGSYDSTVKLWAPAAPGARQVLPGIWGASGVAVSPDNLLLATAAQDGAIKLWDTATGQEGRTLKGNNGPVTSLAFGREHNQLLLAAAHRGDDKEGRIVLWDVAKGKVLHTLKGHPGGVTSMALTADGTLLASGGADKVVRLWDVGKGTVQRELPGSSGVVEALAFSPSGRLLAAGDSTGGVRLWPTAGGKETSFKERHSGAVTALAFSPDEKELASASADQTVKRWDPASGQALVAMRGHAGPVLVVAYSPAGEAIVSGGADGTVRLWDTPRAEPRFTFTGHTGPVRGVAFTPDRRLLASASQDGTVRLWRAGPQDAIPVAVQEGE